MIFEKTLKVLLSLHYRLRRESYKRRGFSLAIDRCTRPTSFPLARGGRRRFFRPLCSREHRGSLYPTYLSTQQPTYVDTRT